MADKEKVIRKKKVVKKEEDTAPTTTVLPENEPVLKSCLRSSTKSSTKRNAAKRCGSNVFSMFSTQQVTEFKEGFAMMDKDQDGFLGKSDLRATWNEVGKTASDQELQEMLSEASGPINFTQLLSLFASKMQGGADDDETVKEAFLTFDQGGKINVDSLSRALLTWGDKFSQKELNDAFEVIDVDRNGNIETENLVKMLTAGGEAEI